MSKRNRLVIGLSLMTAFAVAAAIWTGCALRQTQKTALAQGSICKLLGELKDAGLADSTTCWYSPKAKTGGITCYTSAAVGALKSESAQRVLADYAGCRKALKGWNFPPLKVEDFVTKTVYLTIS